MSRPVSILAALLVGALLLVGCGSDGLSKSDYSKRVTKAAEAASADVDAATADLGSHDSDDAADAMRKMGSAVDDFADELEAFEPEDSEMQEHHADLVEAVRDMAKLSQDMAPRIEDDGLEAVSEDSDLMDRADRTSKRIEQAMEPLVEEGWIDEEAMDSLT